MKLGAHVQNGGMMVNGNMLTREENGSIGLAVTGPKQVVETEADNISSANNSNSRVASLETSRNHAINGPAAYCATAPFTAVVRPDTCDLANSPLQASVPLPYPHGSYFGKTGGAELEGFTELRRSSTVGPLTAQGHPQTTAYGCYDYQIPASWAEFGADLYRFPAGPAVGYSVPLVTLPPRSPPEGFRFGTDAQFSGAIQFQSERYGSITNPTSYDKRRQAFLPPVDWNDAAAANATNNCFLSGASGAAEPRKMRGRPSKGSRYGTDSDGCLRGRPSKGSRYGTDSDGCSLRKRQQLLKAAADNTEIRHFQVGDRPPGSTVSAHSNRRTDSSVGHTTSICYATRHPTVSSSVLESPFYYVSSGPAGKAVLGPVDADPWASRSPVPDLGGQFCSDRPSGLSSGDKPSNLGAASSCPNHSGTATSDAVTNQGPEQAGFLVAQPGVPGWGRAVPGGQGRRRVLGCCSW